jgi:aminocarboxymuconate-semialdehyde decarboxylase
MLQGGFAIVAAGMVGGKSDELAAGRGLAASSKRIDAPLRGTVDIHAHYYPEAYLDLIAEDGKSFGAEYRMTDEGFYYKTPAGNGGPHPIKFINVALRIDDMDLQGTAVQAISLAPPMVYWGGSDLSHKLSTAWNDAASTAHQAYPTRIVGLLTLPMLYPDRAIDELHRASKLPGIRGVYMGTNINNHDLDDPLFEPIWTQIETMDLPVFLHPLQTIGGERLHSYYLHNLLGNPFDTAIAACRLIFGGVLDRHPRLQFSLAHGGGALPILIGRIDHGWQVRPETKHLPQAPSTYLHRFHYDTIVHSKEIIEFLIKEVGAERVMMGSDYCFDMGYERPVHFVEQINITSAERKMILGGTAAKLLRL